MLSALQYAVWARGDSASPTPVIKSCTNCSGVVSKADSAGNGEAIKPSVMTQTASLRKTRLFEEM